MKPSRFCAALLLLTTLGSATAAPPKIGLLLKGRNPFWDEVQKGATEAAGRLGVELVVKAPPTEADVAIQIALLRSLSTQGLKALIIAATNKDALAGPVADLAAKGVKIVAIDSPLSGASASAFVGTDQMASGEAIGAVLAKLVTDTDEVAFLKHDQIGGAAGLREAGALAKLKSIHPGIVVHGDIYASTEEGLEPERSAFLMDKYPGVKAIFANGAAGTAAMLKVLAQRKLTGSIKLVGTGYNLNPAVVAALKDGSLSVWVAQLPEDVGTKGVETALALLAGRSVPAVTNIDFLVVTAENLDDPRVRNLPE